MENTQELAKETSKSVKGDDALINKVALEMAGTQTNAMDTFQKAPDNAFSRYGMVTAQGLAKTPEGILNAAKHYANDPLAALETVGMGAGMAVVLKAVLPETGPVGKTAALGIAGILTYKAAEPIIDGYKQAGSARSMLDMNNASSQIGNALGVFAVDSVFAVAGYKMGAKFSDKMLATPTGAKFVEARTGMYDKIGAKVSDTLGITAVEAGGLAKPRHFHPEGYGVVPPYMLDELVARNPNNGDFLKTRNRTSDMQNNPGGLRPRNEAGQDFQGAREVYDAQGRQQQPGQKARFEGEKPTGNVEVDNSYDFTGDVRKFYVEIHGRNGIDGKGMKYVSTVNYGKNYENAFWDGKQMTYGKPGPDSPFKTFVLRDVTAHEITHGVTEMESNLRYYGQAGALNESHSDVFGALVEQFTKKQTADKGSWLTGEGIWKDHIKGRALRDMKNPGTAYNDPAVGKDPQPGHMKDYVKTWGDNGGVHYNSGIPNRAFTNFAIDMGGFAWEKSGKIWFDARKVAGDNPSFAQFAHHTIESAKKLNMPEAVPKLEKAWESVGVKPDINAKDTHTPGGGGDVNNNSLLRRLFSRKAS